MQLLNYIYFLVITLLGIKFLYSSGIVVRHPLDHTQQILLDGPEMFWVLTFATSLLAFSADGLVVDLMALRLFVLEVLCFIGIIVVRHRPIWSMAIWGYVIYLMWIVIGCSYSPSPVFGFRVFLKYLYPFVLCLFASAAVRHEEVFLKASLGTLLVATVSLVFSFVPGFHYLVPGVFWYTTAKAINYISMMVLCLTLFFFTTDKLKFLVCTILFLLPCFIWVLRTSIMGSLVAISAFFFIKYRVRSLPIIFIIFVAGVVAVFSIPSLRNKMFKIEYQHLTIEQFQEGKVTMEKVETNAREAMWNQLEKRFYEGHEIKGSGTGAVQHYMYSNYVFGGLTVPHSDFVQQRCDNGIIGLFLYGAVALLIFLHCLKIYHNTENVSIQMCAITAGATMAGVYVTLYSDNVVNYSMATLSMPFGFYGMMLGLLQEIKEKE